MGNLAGVAVRLKPATGYDVVRALLGLLLLAAAVLKAHQLATEPVLGAGLLDSRWVLIATVEFELFFGLWLLAGLLPRLTWAAAIGCFVLFAGVSLHKALSGAASCGCFGRVEVNPWYTCTLDVRRPRIDGFQGYPEAVDLAFGPYAKYGQIIKDYRNATQPGRYAPPEMVGAERKGVFGIAEAEERTNMHFPRRAAQSHDPYTGEAVYAAIAGV
ncbi:MAG: hypothetical protein JW809_08260 [Pirellulales bacterium]|nr:hypothetical protein [Pirellulales bacterium]